MAKRARRDELDRIDDSVECLILPFNWAWILFPQEQIIWGAPEKAFPGLCFFFDVSILQDHSSGVGIAMKTSFPLRNRGRGGERCSRHGPFGCHCIGAESLGRMTATLIVECNGRLHPIEDSFGVGLESSRASSLAINENGEVDLLLMNADPISFPFPSPTKLGPFFRLCSNDTLDGILAAFSRGWNSYGTSELEAFGPMPSCGVCRKVTYLPQKCSACFRKLCEKCNASHCDRCQNVCCAVCLVRKTSVELVEDCCPMCLE